MPSFTDLMQAAASGSVTITEDWMQGRTTYGGLSAALCYAAAKPLIPESMPLRSAQIGFVGPAGGPVTLHAEVLRQGKSSCFISADVRSEAGVATRGLFVFGARRDSGVRIDHMPRPPKVNGPEEVQKFFGDSKRRPNFTQNFNMRLAGGSIPMSGANDADMTLWMRHRDEAATGIDALLAIGDAPPPAAMATFTQPAMISSMTWAIEMLTDEPATQDRWWLARHTSPQGRDGYCLQDMTLWNTDGEVMMIGQQTVAVFG